MILGQARHACSALRKDGNVKMSRCDGRKDEMLMDVKMRCQDAMDVKMRCQDVMDVKMRCQDAMNMDMRCQDVMMSRC